MKHPKTRYSFRAVLSVAVLICWILPIVIICVLASTLLNQSYNGNLRSITQARVETAMIKLEQQLDSAARDSGSVSYDAVIRETTQGKADETGVDAYLRNKFSQSTLYSGAFLAFRDPEWETQAYLAGWESVPEAELRQFQETVLPAGHEILGDRIGDFAILSENDRLYLVRNLADDRLAPAALLAIELNRRELVQSVEPLAEDRNLVVTIDSVTLPFTAANETEQDPSRTAELFYSSELDGHTLTFTGQVIGLNLWTTVPMLRWVVFSACVLVLPMLTVIIVLFLRNINRPISVLMDASRRMRNNERGYQIQDNPPNTEFALLYQDFNVMSTVLKDQFEQLYQEQQELQQARIKALQSQINPHFLNNTLEVINWEARMQGDEQVSSMIEALSTMLDAAIGRGGRSLVCLSQEMKYVEAYLYITQVRLDERLVVTRQIAPETMQCTVPLLILQPVLENAVEYDLSHTGGELCLRAFLQEGKLHLEAEHTGKISEEGWAALRESLNRCPGETVSAGRSVGVRNIVNRLALIYGDEAWFDIRQIAPERVLAELVLPPRPAKYQQI